MIERERNHSPETSFNVVGAGLELGLCAWQRSAVPKGAISLTLIPPLFLKTDLKSTGLDTMPAARELLLPLGQNLFLLSFLKNKENTF